MKKIVIIFGLITAIIAVILSVSQFSKFAIIPIIMAFISGLVVLFLSKKEKTKTKPLQYIFLLVIISLGFTIYKGLFKTSEVNTPEQLELKADKNIENQEQGLEEINKDDNI